MTTSKTQYKQDLKAEFAHYGFASSPLSDSEIGTLYTLGYSLGDAYGIGCDVSSGFHFDEAIKEVAELGNYADKFQAIAEGFGPTNYYTTRGELLT